MVPAVDLEDLLVVARELPGLLRLPKDPRARPHERVVEHLLVVGPLPPAGVQGLERLATQGDTLEPVASRLGLLGSTRLESSKQARRSGAGNKVRFKLVVDRLEHKALGSVERVRRLVIY